MKVLVIEIEKDTLIKCLQKFELTDQITFLDGLEVSDEDAKFYADYQNIDEPYYIEENIADLDKIITLCNDTNYIEQGFTWNEFCGFWDLMLNIKKQRDIGYPIDDIEYIYKMGKRLNLPIEYHHASELDGYAEETDDFYVITGQSDLGKMELYIENINDFVFVFSCKKNKDFAEMKWEEFTHWHPFNYIEAFNDMVAFMSNDEEYFKHDGYSLLDD